MDWASGNIEGDPQFIYIENNNFNIKQTSSAIGIGTLKNAFPVDNKGCKRFSDFDNTDASVDVGYFNYSNQVSFTDN